MGTIWWQLHSGQPNRVSRPHHGLDAPVSALYSATNGEGYGPAWPASALTAGASAAWRPTVADAAEAATMGQNARRRAPLRRAAIRSGKTAVRGRVSGRRVDCYFTALRFLVMPSS